MCQKIDDEGYSGSFQDHMWKFYKRSFIVDRTQKQDTLYAMHAKLCKDEANVAPDPNGELWHKRIGHMSKMKRGMHILAGKKLLSEVKGLGESMQMETLL